ncbi:MerR family transcriptional regulator [Companilactobacillus mishanensis]|uniref:MerR family transcriptional regulator n=1 Tax=Companilactobacillus mishanensis TaxID=2486008 RepID=A0ABW9P6Z3_9LACO|nr:MerR family transcriptional regulator [Companilactobacillus mishanensis]MQS44722.1 MerR family transcriptional regulator [Companilactobacillus mishanensis]
MYTIKEVSVKFDVTYDTLRYYEQIELLPPIGRNSQGQREYSDSDIEELNKVMHLRKLGATITECKDFMTLLGNGKMDAKDYDNGIEFLHQLDINLDKRISEIQEQKEFLQRKTDHLESEKNKLKNLQK